MQALLFANLTRKILSSSLGGEAFAFPNLVQGDDLTIALRFAQRINGRDVQIDRVVTSLKASIGLDDARPTRNSFALKIGSGTAVVGTNVTTALPFNVKGPVLENAINALTVITGETYGECSVVEDNGSYLLTFAGETAAVPIEAASNSLAPMSFVRVRSSEIDGAFVHEIRLIQAPVAFTDSFSAVVPPPPVITELRAGGEADGSSWNEIQKLYIPPEFRGLYQIRRGSARSDTLSRADGVAQILAAMNAGELADEDGEFVITNPGANVAHIEFTGSMGGEDQALLTIDVFDAPSGDPTFTLDLNKPEVNAILRAQPSVTLPLEIEMEIQDVNDEEVTYTHTIRTEVTIVREVTFEELASQQPIDWQRPPLPENYIPFSADQVSNGQLHYATPVGDGVATEFVIDHNLNTPRVDVIVHLNSSAGAPLVYGTDYTWTRTNDNSLTVTAEGDAPAEDAWLVTVLGLAQTSFFDSHTHSIAQITGLQTILDGYGLRLNSLEALAPSGSLSRTETSPAETAAWLLPELFEVWPFRGSFDLTGFTNLQALSAADVILPRAGGLLPAVHDAAVEAMTDPAPTPSDSYIGRVFENQGSTNITLPGKYGHRSVDLKPGQFAACDGRMWYRVAQYGSATETSYYPHVFERTLFELYVNEKQLRLKRAFTVEFGLELGLLNATSKAQWTLVIELGTAPQDASPATPGINLQNIIWPSEVDYSAQNFTAAVSDVITCAGHGYSTGMQVQVSSSDTLPAGLSAATNYYVIGVDTNTFKLASSPANAWAGTAVDITDTGTGTHSVQRLESPALEQRVIVTPVPQIHRFGIRVTRTLTDDVDTLALDQLIYGTAEGGVPPLSANFAVRARLIRFDTENAVTDPTGLVALRGLNADLSQEADGNDIGRAKVS